MKKQQLDDAVLIQLHSESTAKGKSILEQACGKELFAPKPDEKWKKIITLKSVFAITKPTKEELAILNYKGTNDRMIGLKGAAELFHIVEALNGGKEHNWDNSNEYKYSNYWDMTSGGGFSCSGYGGWLSSSSVGSRLSLISREHAEHMAKHFPTSYKLFMQKKHERK